MGKWRIAARDPLPLKSAAPPHYGCHYSVNPTSRTPHYQPITARIENRDSRASLRFDANFDSRYRGQSRARAGKAGQAATKDASFPSRKVGNFPPRRLARPWPGHCLAAFAPLSARFAAIRSPSLPRPGRLPVPIRSTAISGVQPRQGPASTRADEERRPRSARTRTTASRRPHDATETGRRQGAVPPTSL